MAVQAVSLVAAGIVLYAFFQQQQGVWQPTDARYLPRNFVATAVLTVIAWIGSQWGSVVIEAVWAVVSLGGLMRAGARWRAPLHA